eukprot:UN13044
MHEIQPRFLRDSPRIKAISPPVKAKPPDYREIEVGITSGPVDAPDVLLEREAVEIGKNETYRSLTARLIKKNNFNIVNLKNLEGYLLEQVADDIILATRPPPQTIWMEIAILEADDKVLREVRDLRQQAVTHKEDHRRWISETDELCKTVAEYMEQR